MKKFTNVVRNTTKQLPYNEKLQLENLSVIDTKIKKLIESLHVDVEGVETPWVDNVVISESEAFRATLNELVDAVYHEEKKKFLEQAHTAIVTRDITFITEQLDKLNESKNRK